MKKTSKSNTIPTSFLPRGSKRITKEDGTRVWQILGKEYASKAEFIQYLRDVQLMKKAEQESKRSKRMNSVTEDLTPEISATAIQKETVDA
jgi:hypothetical protein